MMYSACASRVTPGSSHRCFRPNWSNAGTGASSLGIDQELPTTKISSFMFIVACGDSYTEGEGLEDKNQAYPYLLSNNVKNLAQSGASEYLITTQVEEAVKMKPDLIVIGHTSEWRWHVWDFRNKVKQGFLIANHVINNEKYYRNWIFSEQILANRRKNTKEHRAAWHAAGMLYFSEEQEIQQLWTSFIAKQILITERAGIRTIHHSCFPHLHKYLAELTDDHVKFHLDLEKHKDFAPDRSHAGAKSHSKLAELIKSRFQPNP